MEWSVKEIWRLLGEVLDPEVPVISVVELGIVREVHLRTDTVEVVVTPTYSGCPALKVIEDSIRDHLLEHGVPSVSIINRFAPP